MYRASFTFALVELNIWTKFSSKIRRIVSGVVELDRRKSHSSLILRHASLTRPRGWVVKVVPSHEPHVIFSFESAVMQTKGEGRIAVFPTASYAAWRMRQ